MVMTIIRSLMKILKYKTYKKLIWFNVSVRLKIDRKKIICYLQEVPLT